MSRRLDEDQAIKENVTVSVRFRPLSPREIRRGEEVAWYADGDTVVRSGQNPNVCFTYDRVFAPTTTTLKVYEVAAQHVVSGAMEGICGAIFSYGVTSSGKTHTMHGDQRSPGIIPLVVKDAFAIIQEMPNREFLLRVSYLEIYNEVVHDLLNPVAQNLRIRNDPQGTFVEGVKEEVILSPAHALSLIAAGEEHRHDGSTGTNFSLLSSRSHLIFTLTIESNYYGESNEGEAVIFSKLHLIDLAGPVSAMARTSGARGKEVSYFNESVITLETVISKLTDGKATHIPFQDSKLTQLLQSSLSGQGRVSLICTVTPASSKSVETLNTLKIAQLAKGIEVEASQNKIIDEKSLIKEYRNEIHKLKEEVELRLEEEEDAKSALLARIQWLTKLILISTKANHTSRFCPNPGLRRHTFEEEELAYLRHSSRDIMLDYEIRDMLDLGEKFSATRELSPTKKKNKLKRIFNWFKIRKLDGGASTLRSSDRDKSSLTKSAAPSTSIGESLHFPVESRISNYLFDGSLSDNMLSFDHVGFLSDDLPGEENPPQVGTKTILTEEASRNLNKNQVNAADNREIRGQLHEKTSECMDEQLSQSLQAKDSLSNVMQKNSGVDNGAQQHSYKEKTIPTEISAEALQNDREVSRLIDALIGLMGDMKNQMAYFGEHLSRSLADRSDLFDKLQQR